MKRVLATSVLLITAALSAETFIPRHAAKQKLIKIAAYVDDAKSGIHITEGPKVAYVSAHHAVVQWTTNVTASSVLHYGLTAENLDKSEHARGTAKSHRIQLSKLKSDTEYHFKVTSNGAGGGSVTSEVGSFKTNNRGERPNRYPEQPK